MCAALIAQETYNALQYCSRITHHLTFPDNDHAPAGFFQQTEIAPVALNVAIKLRLPIFRACCRHGSVFAAGMPVPEASVHENHSPVLPQDNIGLSGKVFAIDAKAVAAAVQHGTHDEFRLRVFAANAAHGPASLLGCQGIRHIGSQYECRFDVRKRGQVGCALTWVYYWWAQ